MNRKQKNKLIGILCALALLSLAASFILYALKQNINLFYTPTQLREAIIKSDQAIRLGGYVKKASVQYDASGAGVNFIVTDQKNEIPVSYHGVLPNLFREGQGVVVTGKISAANTMDATSVLAKHDEKYMPSSLLKALQKNNATIQPLSLRTQ